MPFTEDVINGVERLSRTWFRNPTDMAAKVKVGQPIISKLLARGVNPRMDIIGRLLDGLGARIVFPDEVKDTTKDCVFVNVKKAQHLSEVPSPLAADYRAIPMVEGKAAAGPGMVTKDGLKNWVLVFQRHPSVQFRSNLLAIEVDKDQRSMIPTLHPGDIVLVDKDDKDPKSGGIFLVMDPDGGVAVKRVKIEPRGGKTMIIFYSDNAEEYSPTPYFLEDDYGEDLGRAIVGRIVWSWSDMTKK